MNVIKYSGLCCIALIVTGCNIGSTQQDTNGGASAQAKQLKSIGTINAGDNADGISISPDGRNAYVINYADNTISEYTRDTSTGQRNRSMKYMWQ